MTTRYTSFEIGFNAFFLWQIDESDPSRRYWVSGLNEFCYFGPAIVDDFGNLVKVPR